VKLVLTRLATLISTAYDMLITLPIVNAAKRRSSAIIAGVADTMNQHSTVYVSVNMASAQHADRVSFTVRAI
jgi:hypothetical protein